MNRAEKFEKIFASRKESTNKAKAAIEKLTNVQRALESCQSMLKAIVAQLNDSPDDNVKNTAVGLQDEIKRNYLQKINDVLREMSVIEARFSRQRINIGITGNAGIGKSTLLQNLTGLSGDIIPARDPNNPMGGSCTGAPSVIENNLDNDRTYADVEFYQESEFFEDILLPYYKAINQRARVLGLDDWTRHPVNFDDFMNNPLPELSEELEQDVLAHNLYKALKDRHEHASQYSRDFGHINRNIDKESEIRRYVAQKDADNNDNFEWIPVKLVRIYCPFKNANGERNTDPFSVCDTPGLGDIGCKADDSLASNIAENVDAVWMMNLVTANCQTVRQSDCDLYAIFRDVLPEWRPQQWVYGVINRYTGTTPEQVQAYRNEMKKRFIEVRKVFELDARNAESVLESFEATLDDIVENQSAIDETLFMSRNEKAVQLLESIRVFAEERLKKFLEENRANSMDINVARERFNEEVWPNLRNNLNDLKDRYEEQSKRKNEALEKCVRNLSDKKDDPDFLVKPIQTIAVEIRSDPLEWLKNEMDRLRVALGKEISRTGTDLAELFDKLRAEVRAIFYEEGRLAAILPEIASQTDVEWLIELSNKFLDVPTAKPEVIQDIVRGIEAFKKATLTYEQLLEPRITQYGCLDLLNPNKEGKEVVDLFDPKKAKEENKDGSTDEERYIGAFYAQDMLRGQIQQVLEKVCKRLNESIEIDGVPCCILVEPSAALFSTIEKLYLVLFSDKNSSRRWEEFYVEYRDDIWSGDRKRIPLSVLRQWNASVDNLLVALNE